MNIASEITYNAQQPTIFSIRKTGGLNVFAVGPLKGQVFSHHKTFIPALLKK
jgi:hypothetical protein